MDFREQLITAIEYLRSERKENKSLQEQLKKEREENESLNIELMKQKERVQKPWRSSTSIQKLKGPARRN